MASKLDEKVGKYIDDYKKKIGDDLDVDLLRKVTRGCGPTIYNRDSETVAGGDPEEMDRVAKNFAMKKLGVSDEQRAKDAIDSALERYGRSNTTKYRAVFYYLITKELGKEDVYK